MSTSRRKPPTMSDVAREAGVSTMTVSRAFRPDSPVTRETRAAVLQVAERMGYVFDHAASTLRSQRTGFVAALIPSLNNANFADTLRGLSEGLRAQGLQILLGHTDYDVTAEERLIEQLLRRRPEAIMLTGGTHTARARRLLATAGIPVVETWDLPERPIGHVVGFSNAACTREMVAHLLGRGLRRLAFLGGEGERDRRGADRRCGFVAAMAEHGLAADRLIDAGTPPISMREGAQAMARLLDALPDTEGVLCVSDLAAFGALSECQRRGIAVPGDIAIAGFGDYEIAEVSVPSLTTSDPSPHEIGATTARLILEALAGAHPQPRRIEMRPRLCLRDSAP